jgi:hypothetical protein
MYCKEGFRLIVRPTGASSRDFYDQEGNSRHSRGHGLDEPTVRLQDANQDVRHFKSQTRRDPRRLAERVASRAECRIRDSTE